MVEMAMVEKMSIPHRWTIVFPIKHIEFHKLKHKSKYPTEKFIFKRTSTRGDSL